MTGPTEGSTEGLIWLDGEEGHEGSSEDGEERVPVLSNGWYWSGREYEVMAFPMDGWRIRCRWEELLSGRWALTLTAEEVKEDPAPWIPTGCTRRKAVRIRPEVGGHRSWGRPDPRVMEEMSRRAGSVRMGQVVRCCRSMTASTGSSQVSNQYLTGYTV